MIGYSQLTCCLMSALLLQLQLLHSIWRSCSFIQTEMLLFISWLLHPLQTCRFFFVSTTFITVVGMEIDDNINSLVATKAVDQLKQDIFATPDDEKLEPPTWNESQLPYLGDLTPKPTWEIVIKVSHRHHQNYQCH